MNWDFQAKQERATSEEVEEKCRKVNSLQSRSIHVPLKTSEKAWLEGFFGTFVRICDELKESKKKRKRSLEYPNVTKEFLQLEAFKTFVIESKFDDF